MNKEKTKCDCLLLPPISKFIKLCGNHLTLSLVDIVQSKEGCQELKRNREASNSPPISIKLLTADEMKKHNIVVD